VTTRLTDQGFSKRRFFRYELPGLALVIVALLYNAWYAAPELRIGRVPVNDAVFHIAASERLGQGIAEGEPFLNPWVSEWALGYPVWQSYQPLGHLAAAAVFRIFGAVATNEAIFAALSYLLIVFFPLSVYIGARLLGIGPAASGLAALLAFAPSAVGTPGRYGLGYGSVLWRGSGLYTQLFALHLLVIGMGLSARALDAGGRLRRAWAGLMLALTSLSHIIFGYTAFVSAALLAVVGPPGERSRRLARLVSVAALGLALIAWFVAPLILAKGTVGHSRWEDPEKWDSYGAPFILGELFSGRLFDFGRPPLLTGLFLLGIIGIVLARREPVARRLAGLCGLWLALFFGRATWGPLIMLAGVPADLHLHRLQAVFELCAVMMTAYGVIRFVEMISRRTRGVAVFALFAITTGMIWIGADRAAYLKQNRQWGEENLAVYARQQTDLEAAMQDVRAILAERPGRVSAGLSNSWGRDFKIGYASVFGFLSRERFDQASFLYHAMSKTSDVMVVRDESSAHHDTAFGIRAVVAPAERTMPLHLRLRGMHGAFAIYESSPEGYFGLVDLGWRAAGAASTVYDQSAAWLNGPLPGLGVVLPLDQTDSGSVAGNQEAPPKVGAAWTQPRGRIVAESKSGETYRARVQMQRPAYVLLKITWHPDLVATVDGRPATLIPVTPGFGAFAVPAGDHQVEVSFRPGPLRGILLIVGIGAFAAGCLYSRTKTFSVYARGFLP